MLPHYVRRLGRIPLDAFPAMGYGDSGQYPVGGVGDVESTIRGLRGGHARTGTYMREMPQYMRYITNFANRPDLIN